MKSNTGIKEVAISEFKAKCTALVEQVSKTKQPIRITRHGKPIADVVPAAPAVDRASLFGSMRDSIKILGDIVSPVIDLDEIEALRD
ncbi:MAG TPA: type II toxin-antitoxin system Phd/YefM family antitoxin [Candidatus Methylomirabilis sp.]|nr:type II toxin-antitoxin system Phd/YefM family antitoxin [Candidatus Methylomirabilis sp.]